MDSVHQKSVGTHFCTFDGSTTHVTFRERKTFVAAHFGEGRVNSERGMHFYSIGKL